MFKVCRKNLTPNELPMSNAPRDQSTVDGAVSLTDSLPLRHDCPVCLGLPMQTVTWALEGRTLTLDGCDRCGGWWFDGGETLMAAEVQRSGLAGSERLRQYQVRMAAGSMACHQCSSLMRRNLSHCPSCGWANVIDCPKCDVPMERQVHGSLVIDRCNQCHGLWLDRVELSLLDSLSRSPKFGDTTLAIGDRAVTDSWGANAIGEGVRGAVEVAIYAPELGSAVAEGLVAGLEAAPEMATGAVEILAVGLEAAPEMATGAVEILAVGLEVAGESAGAVIELIAGILAGLLGG
jgi:Zn-finger nucleic acid-binding protein